MKGSRNPKRGRDEIIRVILDICTDKDIKKTVIVRRANLNFKTTAPYLVMLKDKGFLEIDQTGEFPVYSITQRGIDLLKELNRAGHSLSA